MVTHAIRQSLTALGVFTAHPAAFVISRFMAFFGSFFNRTRSIGTALPLLQSGS